MALEALEKNKIDDSPYDLCQNQARLCKNLENSGISCFCFDFLDFEGSPGIPKDFLGLPRTSQKLMFSFLRGQSMFSAGLVKF